MMCKLGFGGPRSHHSPLLRSIGVLFLYFLGAFEGFAPKTAGVFLVGTLLAEHQGISVKWG